MKKWVSLLVVLCSFLVALPIIAVGQPRIEIPGGTVHEFGTIYRGESVTHDFLVKNAGTDTLIISGVTASCGCTGTMLSTSRIVPDSASVLKVTFSSGLFSGHVQKSVLVASNDTKTPLLSLYIKSNVIQVLGFDPGSLIFNVSADSIYRSKVMVKNLIDKPIRVLSLEPRYTGLDVKMEKRLLKPGDSAEVSASLKEKGGFEGYRGGSVILKTDFEPQRDQSLNVMVALHK